MSIDVAVHVLRQTAHHTRSHSFASAFGSLSAAVTITILPFLSTSIRAISTPAAIAARMARVTSCCRNVDGARAMVRKSAYRLLPRARPPRTRGAARWCPGGRVGLSARGHHSGCNARSGGGRPGSSRRGRQRRGSAGQGTWECRGCRPPLQLDIRTQAHRYWVSCISQPDTRYLGCPLWKCQKSLFHRVLSGCPVVKPPLSRGSDRRNL